MHVNAAEPQQLFAGDFHADGKAIDLMDGGNQTILDLSQTLTGNVVLRISPGLGDQAADVFNVGSSYEAIFADLPYPFPHTHTHSSV